VSASGVHSSPFTVRGNEDVFADFGNEPDWETKRARTSSIGNRSLVPRSNSYFGDTTLACIAHKSLVICERCRLWQQSSPAAPDNSAAVFREKSLNSLSDFPYFKNGS
jgi:hypothetical protein